MTTRLTKEAFTTLADTTLSWEAVEGDITFFVDTKNQNDGLTIRMEDLAHCDERLPALFHLLDKNARAASTCPRKMIRLPGEHLSATWTVWNAQLPPLTKAFKRERHLIRLTYVASTSDHGNPVIMARTVTGEHVCGQCPVTGQQRTFFLPAMHIEEQVIEQAWVNAHNLNWKAELITALHIEEPERTRFFMGGTAPVALPPITDVTFDG